MSRLLPDDRPASIATALGLGAAPSSCSHAAAVLARSVFRRAPTSAPPWPRDGVYGPDARNSAHQAGVPRMAVHAGGADRGAIDRDYPGFFLFRHFLSRQLLIKAKTQADRGIAGRMEGHAKMDMSVEDNSSWQRLTSDRALTAISHYFVMDWASVWLDIVGGPFDHRCACRLGAAGLLEVVLPARSPADREAMMSDREPTGRSHLVHLFRRQHSTGRGSLERRHQLRRREGRGGPVQHVHADDLFRKRLWRSCRHVLLVVAHGPGRLRNPREAFDHDARGKEGKTDQAEKAALLDVRPDCA